MGNCHEPGSESVLAPAIWRSLFKPWITQYMIHRTYNDVCCETTKCHDSVWRIKGTLHTMLLHFRKQAWEHLYKNNLRHCHSLYLRLGIMKSEKINVNASIQTMFDLPGGKIKSALSSLPFLRASLEEFWKCKPFLFLFWQVWFFLKTASASWTFTAWGPGGGPCGVGREGRCTLVSVTFQPGPWLSGS